MHGFFQTRPKKSCSGFLHIFPVIISNSTTVSMAPVLVNIVLVLYTFQPMPCIQTLNFCVPSVTSIEKLCKFLLLKCNSQQYGLGYNVKNPWGWPTLTQYEKLGVVVSTEKLASSFLHVTLDTRWVSVCRSSLEFTCLFFPNRICFENLSLDTLKQLLIPMIFVYSYATRPTRS